jgi:hypothetical protein
MVETGGGSSVGRNEKEEGVGGQYGEKKYGRVGGGYGEKKYGRDKKTEKRTRRDRVRMK